MLDAATWRPGPWPRCTCRGGFPFLPRQLVRRRGPDPGASRGAATPAGTAMRPRGAPPPSGPWSPTVVAVGLVLAGCGSDDEGDAGEGAAPTVDTAGPTTTTTVPLGCGPGVTAPAAGTERVEALVGGEERWYDRLVPSGYDGSQVALVIDLHGYLSGAETQAAISGFGALASEGFVLATPQGSSDLPYWNTTPEPDLPDDVGFVADVIDEVSATVCIDPDRVYVDGLSNGAFLTSLVACELSDRVAAGGRRGAARPRRVRSVPRPVPVLAIHGTEDPSTSRWTAGPGPALDDLDWNDDSRHAFDGLAFADVTESAATWAEARRVRPDAYRAPRCPQRSG